jgi:hypothetical protein
MKSGLVLAASLIIFTPLWVPYGAFLTKSAGNPNWNSYVGQAGSTYDAAANPPQTIGTVTYNPLAPLPPITPAASSGSASGTMAPGQ